MMKKQKRPATQPQISTDTFLRSIPLLNQSMKLDRRQDGTTLVSVPVRRPSWMAPPLSWILPFSSQKRVELDSLGAEVLDACDGRTVERIIEEFADRHRLSFREAQLAVTMFLKKLAERGLVVYGVNKDDS
jgi:hypothetical protein